MIEGDLASGRRRTARHATVVPAAELGAVAPAPGSAKVELLKRSDYLRVWINRTGTNYLIHLPTS
jgi:hypothetical protein